MKPRLNVLPNITEDWSIQSIVKSCSFGDWQDTFDRAKPNLQQISRIMESERRKHRMCPQQKDIFKIFHSVSLKAIRVVILNDRPYRDILTNGKPQATGIPFAIRKGEGFPPALRNLYVNVQRSYPQNTESLALCDGTLRGWLRQGVFLLNTSLTTNDERRNKYADVWRGFIHKVIRSIVEHDDSIPFVLLGREAPSFAEIIDTANPKVETPSPHSTKMFADATPFQDIDAIFKEQDKALIDWTKM
jgi:uracil-DNA glycosylase